ncbi:MAG: glutaminase, partial [Rubritepida sp.]|nr:glutaminase [Rubritepida sp.]
MHERLHAEDAPGPAAVSTGHLPAAETVAALVAEAQARYAAVSDGTVADYIPALAKASPDWFGISVCGVGGQV